MSPEEKLQEYVRNGRASVVVGTGVAMAACSTAPNWSQAIKSALNYAGSVNPDFAERVKSYIHLCDENERNKWNAIDSAANYLGYSEGKDWANWLKTCFGQLKPDDESLIHAIGALNLPILTTNYDTIIEKVLVGRSPVCPVDAVTYREAARKPHDYVFHIHGVWDNPRSILWTQESYRNRQNDRLAIGGQDQFSKDGLIFIGCGETLTDPNFSQWARLFDHLRVELDAPPLRLFCDQDNCDGSIIEGVRYGEKYSDLLPFLRDLGSHVPPPPPPPPPPPDANEKVLQDYLEATIKVWGKWRIDLPNGFVASDGDLENLLGRRRAILLSSTKTVEVADNYAEQVKEGKQESLKDRDLKIENVVLHLLSGKNSLVSGEAGVGKTTIIQTLLRKLAASRKSCIGAPVPMLVPAKAITAERMAGGLNGLIATAVESLCETEQTSHLYEMVLEAVCEKRRLAIIVDGFDELRDDELREKLKFFLINRANLGRDHLIIVASREIGFEQEIESFSLSFERCRIERLNSIEITRFFEQWIDICERSKGEFQELSDRVNRIVADRELNSILASPMLLAMVGSIAAIDLSVPDTPYGIIRRAVQLMIERRGLDGEPRLTPANTIPILMQIADEIYKNNSAVMWESQVHSIIDNALNRRLLNEGPERLLKAIVEKTNILEYAGAINRGGYSEPGVKFHDEKIGEYLMGMSVYSKYSLNIIHYIDQLSVESIQYNLDDSFYDIGYDNSDVMHDDSDYYESLFYSREITPLVYAIAELSERARNETFNFLICDPASPPVARARLALALELLREITLSDEDVEKLADRLIASDSRLDATRTTSVTAIDQRLVNAASRPVGRRLLSSFIDRTLNASLSDVSRNRAALFAMSCLGESDENWLVEASEQAFLLSLCNSATSDDEIAVFLVRLIQELAKASPELVSHFDHHDEALVSLGHVLVNLCRERTRLSHLSAWALAWLILAKNVEWDTPVALEKLASEIPSLFNDAPIPVLASLVLARSKLSREWMPAYRDFDLIYKSAVICDTGGGPLALPSIPPGKLDPSVAQRIKQELTASALDDAPLYTGRKLATALARFDIFTDESIEQLVAFASDVHSDEFSSDESLFHLLRASAECGCEPFLRILEQCTSEKKFTRAWLVLVAQRPDGLRDAIEEIVQLQERLLGPDDVKGYMRTIAKVYDSPRS